jgi:hypothetical protein
MGGTGKRNELTRHWVQKQKGELTIISTTGENEDEKKQWNRKRWVLLIEIFMYFGSEYILSGWNNCILHVVKQTYYIRVKNNQVNESLNTFFMKTFQSTDCLLGNFEQVLQVNVRITTWQET